MMVQVLLCTLAALIGLPLGYWLGFVHTEAERLMDAYLQGLGMWGFEPELWR